MLWKYMTYMFYFLIVYMYDYLTTFNRNNEDGMGP